MAVESYLSKAEKDLNDENYSSAQEYLDSAFKDAPESFKGWFLQSTVYLRTKKVDEAIEASAKALSIARVADKREWIAQGHYAQAMAYYRKKQYEEAYKHSLLSTDYNEGVEGHAEIGIFFTMAQKKYKKHFKGDIEESKKTIRAEEKEVEKNVVKNPVKDDKPKKTPAPLKKKVATKQPVAKVAPAPAPVTPVVPAKPAAPAAQKMRSDWFDSASEVEVSVFIKKIDPSTLTVNFAEQSVSAEFKDKKGFSYKFSYPALFDKIDAKASHYRVFGTKLELVMVKLAKSRWTNIESGSAAPKEEKGTPLTSFSKVSLEEENEDEVKPEGDEAAMDFFRKLYADADDDTKKAMMKSYQESNGTSLSTDWSDVSKKTIHPYKSEDED